MDTKIFIDGQAGTAGLQLRQRLEQRGDIQLLAIDDKFRKNLDARAELLNAADIAILCLPDEAARSAVSIIENKAVRVIDTSSAHRVAPGWVYGLPEMTENQAGLIANARFVSNPGCYPQGIIACVRPFIEAGLLGRNTPLTCNAISGYSGGGRQLIEEYEQAPDSAPPILPYALTLHHKHLPEITQYCMLSRAPIFQPAVGHFAQGMLCAIPLFYDYFSEAVSGKRLHEILHEFYSQDMSAIGVEPLSSAHRLEILAPHSWAGSDKMQIQICANDNSGQAVLYAVYDNLGKGAAGAAMQNIDLLMSKTEALSGAA